MQRAQGSRRIQGYLWKEGKSTKRWRRRWFAYVPESSSLAYYEYSDDRKELGSIPLTPNVQVFPDSDNSYRNGKVAPGKQKWIFHIRNTVRNKDRPLTSSQSSVTLSSPNRHSSPTPGDSPPPTQTSATASAYGASDAEQVVYHLMAATENEMWFWIAGLQHVKLQGSREQLSSRFRSTAKEEKSKVITSVVPEDGRSPRPGAKLSRMSRIMDKERPGSMDVLAAFEEHDEELEDLTFEDLSIATTASYMKYQETQRVAVEAMEAGEELDEDQDLARLVALEDALVQGHKELVVARREVKQKDQEIHILHKHLQGYYQELKSTMAKLEEEKHKRRELAILSGSGGIYVSDEDTDEEEGEFDRWIDDYDMEKAELVEANSLLRQELRDIKTQLLKENTERMRLQKENKDLRAALVYGERHQSDDEDSATAVVSGRRGRGGRGGGEAKKRVEKKKEKKKTSPSGASGKGIFGGKEESKRGGGGGGGAEERRGEEERRGVARQHASYSSIHQVRGKWGMGADGDLLISGTAAATERDFRSAMRSSTDGNGLNGKSSSSSNLLSASMGDCDSGMKRSRSEQMPQAFWVPDEDATECESCGATFGLITRRHHCRICGRVFCSKCCSNWIGKPPERLRACDECATGCNS